MKNQDFSEWKAAIGLLCQWGHGHSHVDDLLDRHHVGNLRWLVMEIFRNWLLIEGRLAEHLRRKPRPEALNLLRMGVGECLNRDAEDRPKVVHHAVEVAQALGLKKAECGFINAVLRNVLRNWDKVEKQSPLATHPTWLVKRWRKQFEEAQVEKLVDWNQRLPQLVLRAESRPAYAEESPWAGYYYLPKKRFPEAEEDLRSGKIYMQDPFTRHPAELLDARPGEHILDLCAAPGGKTRMLAQAMQGRGKLLALDKPGKRMERLRENLDRAGHEWVSTVADRVESFSGEKLQKLTGSEQVDGILIDVPCSNTGVIQKRPDVKLRLTEASVSEQADQQGELLSHAAKWVRTGGRIVYSTCSLEHEENGGVVDRFLEMHAGWELTKSVISYPWECEHDGGGAFLLTRLNSGKK
jgi:16S rRNA (cytosine967-C5)-methyltransferase